MSEEHKIRFPGGLVKGRLCLRGPPSWKVWTAWVDIRFPRESHPNQTLQVPLAWSQNTISSDNWNSNHEHFLDICLCLTL